MIAEGAAAAPPSLFEIVKRITLFLGRLFINKFTSQLIKSPQKRLKIVEPTYKKYQNYFRQIRLLTFAIFIVGLAF